MSTGSNSTTMLKDVVAYVDVWSSSKTDNYSTPFIQQLQEMGAKVSKSFNKHITHVVFKNGHQATWNKAKKNGVKLVSVLWVARCKDDGEHVDEDLYPALSDDVIPALKKRTHRCMQPRDTPERTPENDRRMKKKLDQMIKDLPPILPLFTDVSPYIINQEHGIIYSPSLKRSDSMAQRLKEMREKRENPSPTASQESSGSPGLKPSLGGTQSTSVFKLLDDGCEDESNTSVAAQHHYSPNKEDEEKQHTPDHCEPSSLHKKDSQKPWLSPCSDGPRQRSVIHVNHLDLDYLEKGTKQNKKPRRSSVKKDPMKKHISLDSLESPCQEDRPEESKNWQSQLKPDIPAVGKSVKSPSEFKKGKRTNRTVKSSTKIKTYANLEVSNIPSCPSSPTIFGNASVTQRPSKEPSLKVDPQKAKQTRFSFSGFARSSTASDESLTVVSSSVDEDDGVFVECASPANPRQRKRTTLLRSLPSDTKSLSEQGSSTGKRKQRHSVTTGPESAHAKKRKREERQSVTNPSHESVNVDSIPSQQKRPHQGIRESPSSVDSHNINEIPMTRRSRRRTLPALRTGELTTEPVKQRASSIPIKPSKQSISVAAAALEQQKNADGDVPYPMESRGSEHVAAGLTDTTSEGKENKQANLVVQKMDKYRKTMRTLVMTSMPTDKQSTVTEVVKALGGFSIVDSVCESTTHVVSGGPRRTLNILLGIARGCWILSFEWILWCLEQRQWIPEEPYELSDHFPAAPICRLQQHLSAGEHQQDLFEGQPVMFVSPHSEPPTQSLVELIQLCGGTVCKTVRQAGICIGTYNGKRPEGSRILSEQWVLDCITHLKQLSYDNYDLE